MAREKKTNKNYYEILDSDFQTIQTINTETIKASTERPKVFFRLFYFIFFFFFQECEQQQG
jgi:hypothetical protein